MIKNNPKDYITVGMVQAIRREEWLARPRPPLPHQGEAAMTETVKTPMRFFSENVDRWGASEWFDRLASAIREQDKAVMAMHSADGDEKFIHEVAFETYRNIAASSAMHLVRDFETEVRRALGPAISKAEPSS